MNINKSPMATPISMPMVILCKQSTCSDVVQCIVNG